MPRSANQKQKLFALRDYLFEYTDEKHPAALKDIIAYLKSRGIPAERKSVYDDLEALKALGADIKTVREKTVKYYLASRDFSVAELKLLADAVRSSKFIPAPESEALVKKLSMLASRYDRHKLNRELFVSNKAKTLENGVFDTADRIYSAMEENTALKFRYFGFNVKKEKVYRRNGEFYHISPWSLVWDDGNYYLLGFDSEKNEIRHFRVDKMTDVSPENSKRSGTEDFKRFDLAGYSNAVFGMFGGKMQRVKLRCENRLANVMLDRFGKDIAVLSRGDSFDITVNVVPGPTFLGWVISFGGAVEIVSPEDIADKLKAMCESFGK